ncbi:Uncharacterized protein APZ42_025826 [Daphnia magna]|uniref:HAT C-terminal dimerisation domain-containing protein n=1 Tax=Daphnia magna TaxID=35525 RepID=A0A164SQH3_9CRUS|nr:Uncharacterized protein APZ42_025826 [Daphnia magna]
MDVVSSKYRMFPFLGITKHWIQYGKINDICLSLTHLKGPNSGENLFETFIEVVENDFGLLHKPIQNFQQQQKVFDLELEDDAEFENEDMVASNNIIRKLRRLVNSIRSSGQRRELFEASCEDVNVNPLELIIDCPLRWNSTCAMMERALKMKQKSNESSIKKVSLVNREWEFLACVHELLKDYKTTSEAMGNTRYPTISQVFPFFHLIIHKHNAYLGCKAMENPDLITLESSGKPKILIEAVLEARKKLMKYFYMANTSDSLHYVSTANLLDLRFKQEYFRQAGWQTRKINEMREKAHSLWLSVYKPIPQRSTYLAKDTVKESSIADLLWSVCSSETFLPLHDEENNNSDEFQLYLKEPIVQARGFTDIINWWQSQNLKYPNLSEMAMDILAIPATSVPVGREFSGLADIITSNRANLNPVTSETLHELKGYLKFGGEKLLKLTVINF